MITEGIPTDLWVEVDDRCSPRWENAGHGVAHLVLGNRTNSLTMVAEESGLAVLADVISAARAAIAAENADGHPRRVDVLKETT